MSFNSLFNRIFGTQAAEKKHAETIKRDKRNHKSKRLTLEQLESRDLLSVSPWEYKQILQMHPEFDLPETASDVNIIELDANSLSADNLQSAIDQAAQTPQDDLIVVRTTEKSNTVSIANTISVNLDSSEKGAVTFVSLTDSSENGSTFPVSLTLDFGTLSEGLKIESGDVQLGGVTFSAETILFDDSQTLPSIISVADTAEVDISAVSFSWAGSELIVYETTTTGSVYRDLTPEEASLSFIQPRSWTDSIAISNQSVDSLGFDTFTTSDSLFLNAAFGNQGRSAAEGYSINILVNGEEFLVYDNLYLSGLTNSVLSGINLGHFDAGDYTIDVCINYGDSSATQSARITIVDNLPIPGMVNDLSTEFDSQYYLYKATWEANENADRYFVFYKNQTTGETYSFVTENTYAYLSNIQKGGAYSLSVSAVNAEGMSEPVSFDNSNSGILSSNVTSSTINKNDPFNISLRVHNKSTVTLYDGGSVTSTYGNSVYLGIYSPEGVYYTFDDSSYTNIPDIYVTLMRETCNRWESIITSGLNNVTNNGLVIDDLLIDFGFMDYGEESNTLGSSWTLTSGPYVRKDNGLTIAGTITYNSQIFTANPDNNTQQYFKNVVLHEIAHVLGYSDDLWADKGILGTASSTPAGFRDVDYYPVKYYKGANGIREFKKVFGNNDAFYNNGFLLETITLDGSYACHISSVYATQYSYLNQHELMNWQACDPETSTTTSLSAITIGVLEDVGYTVDYAMADPFGTVAPTNLVAVNTDSGIKLSWTGCSCKSYTVERLNTSSVSAVWTTVKSGLTGVSYTDTTAVAGTEYEYRVIANNIKTQVQAMKPTYCTQTPITWSTVSNATEYTVYKLNNYQATDGSFYNYMEWEQYSTTSSNRATIEKTGYYMVVTSNEVQTTQSSQPSRAVRITKEGSKVPDLATSNLTSSAFTSTDLEYGNYFGVKDVPIKNIGKKASDSYKISFYASANPTITASDILLEEKTLSSLGVNKTTYQYSRMFSTAEIGAGEWYIGWIISGGGDTATANNTGMITDKLTIKKCNIEVFVSSFSSKIYDGTTDASGQGSYSFSGYLDRDKGLVSVSGGTWTYDNANAGSGKTVTLSGYSLTGSKAGNYQLAASSVKLTNRTITPKSLTVSATASGKTYDGTTSCTTGSYTLSGLLAADNSYVALSGGAWNYSDKNAGSGRSVTYSGYSLSGTKSGNYSLSNTSVTSTSGYTISKAPLTITADNKTINYGANPAYTVSYTGFVGGETASSAAKSGSISYAVTDSSGSAWTGATGTYTISAMNSSLAYTNYNITWKNGTLTVSKNTSLNLSLTGFSGTYDGYSHGVSLSGTQSGDVVLYSTNNSTWSSAAPTLTNVGSKTVYVKVQRTGFQDWTSSASININKAALSVWVKSGLALTYGDNPSALFTSSNLEFSGFKGSDGVSKLSGSPVFSGYSQYGDAGSYTVKVTGGYSSSNYNITYLGKYTQNLTVGKKTLTVSVLPTSGAAVSKTYDGTVSISNGAQYAFGTGQIVNGDSVSLSGGTYQYAGANVGTGIKITYSGYSLAGTDRGNYVLSASSASANIGTITKASLAAAVKNQTITYGSAPDFAVSLSGFKGSDSAASLGLSASAFNFSGYSQYGAVGAYPVSATLKSTVSLSNYNLTTTAGTLTVSPKSVTVQIDSVASKAYDSNKTASGAYSIVGLVNSDAVTLTGTVYQFTEAKAGTNKTVKLTWSGVSGAKAGNYALTNTTAAYNSGTITKVPLTVSVNDLTVAADQTPRYTVTYNGFVGEENQSALAGSLTFSSNQTINGAGTYTITASGLTSDNYSITYRTGTLTVQNNSAIAGISLTGYQGNYDAKAHTITVA